jgi:hypothetical protein
MKERWRIRRGASHCRAQRVKKVRGLTAGISNLDTSLTNVDRDNFTHFAQRSSRQETERPGVRPHAKTFPFVPGIKFPRLNLPIITI